MFIDVFIDICVENICPFFISLHICHINMFQIIKEMLFLH